MMIICLIMVSVLLTSCTGQRTERNIDKTDDTSEPGILSIDEKSTENEKEKQDRNEIGAERENIQEVTLYFLNKSQNSLLPEIQTIRVQRGGYVFNEIIDALSRGPQSNDLESVIPDNTKLLSASHVEGIVSVNLSESFLEAQDLLVARASLVNTLVAIEGIDFVRIYVEGSKLTKDGTLEGEVLGILAQFPSNVKDIIAQENELFGKEDMRKLDWELYFQDREGELLLSEIRSINVRNMEYARTIVEELIKGPSASSLGLYRAIPYGARLQDVELIKSQEPEGKDIINLYFSEDFAKGLNEGTSSFEMAVASLVYSLTALNNVGWVNIVNQDGAVTETIGTTEAEIPKSGFNRDNFTDVLGRRIRVYFSDRDAMHLVPEYRAMSRGDLRIARKLISELIEGPGYEGNTAVMPEGLSINKVRVWIENKTAFVDLPTDINFNQMGSTGETMAIYAMVNSLTDPLNTRNIEKVQFLVGGRKVEGLGHLSLYEPFIRNPALINDK